MNDNSTAAPPAEPAEIPPDAQAAAILARARRLMIISGLTTMIAIAAVVAAIGYRVFRAGGSGGVSAPAEALITLPKGARVTAASVVGDRIVVTLDIAGAVEIRTFDVKTLQQTGRIRFATEP
jgi:hypothetical protein